MHMKKQRYQWLLFDADGTLFDYAAAEETALRAAFDECGVAFSMEHLHRYRAVNQAIWLEFERGTITADALRSERFRRLFDACAITADAAAFGARYVRLLAQVATLIDGALDVARTLAASHKLAVITNGLKDVQHSRFERSPLKQFVSAIVISDEIGVAKPDAAFFDVTFCRIGNPAKHDVLVVGDSLTSDIQGGINYGIDTCWFNPLRLPRPAGRAATYEITALPELYAIV
jgi:2-haloacid dehalogenase